MDDPNPDRANVCANGRTAVEPLDVGNVYPDYSIGGPWRREAATKKARQQDGP